MFKNVYAGKKVLVTGHTGFKGAWLCAWLLQLGANVVGYSKNIPTQPSMFALLGLGSKVDHHLGDVRDLHKLRALIDKERPDILVHLAAQSIVSTSYRDPTETFTSNAVGTMNVLEALRSVGHSCVAVLITSDKCYDNVEWIWGYRENDRLGGKDIYSASKAAAEVIIRAYLASFLSDPNGLLRVGIARAGNVIGGGDWARDRIVVDCVTAWSEGRSVEIRSPEATRPWQHVLEPLSGYLALGAALLPAIGSSEQGAQKSLHGEAFNFGPRAEQNRTVSDLIAGLAKIWGLEPNQAFHVANRIRFHEAGLLKLNCDKALAYLNWEATLSYEETLRFVGDWYVGHYKRQDNLFALTIRQIEDYQKAAVARGRSWAQFA